MSREGMHSNQLSFRLAHGMEGALVLSDRPPKNIRNVESGDAAIRNSKARLHELPMSSTAIPGFSALMLAFTAIAGISACGGHDDASGDTSEAGTGGTFSTAAGAGHGGRAASMGGGSGRGSGGSHDAAGTAGHGGSAAGGAGRPVMSGGGAGSMNGSGGAAGRITSNAGNSPYEIECHGDTVSCGDPTSLLCLGLRVQTEVFGYSCSNECVSDADCSTLPASTDAEAGCVDFVNTKYCMLVCRDDDERATCPDGMYCYAYEGATLGYCLWH